MSLFVFSVSCQTNLGVILSPFATLHKEQTRTKYFTGFSTLSFKSKRCYCCYQVPVLHIPSRLLTLASPYSSLAIPKLTPSSSSSISFLDHLTLFRPLGQVSVPQPEPTSIKELSTLDPWFIEIGFKTRMWHCIFWKMLLGGQEDRKFQSETK